MISDYLLEGAENAQTAQDLARLLGISSREITATIGKERLAGKPICASSGANPGYYLAANRQEMKDFCRNLEHRIGEVTKTLHACKKTATTLPEA